MVNARLHIICGNCGCSDMFSFRIDPKGKDIDGELSPAVYILCDNCTTLHALDSTMVEDVKK